MLLTSPLSSPLKNPVRDVFSPAGGSPSLTTRVQALFAGGKVGGMWDMGDTATLFQDAATPVTAVTQPIGIVLDKSRGLALGTEAVPSINWNGGYTTNGAKQIPTGWFEYTPANVASATVLPNSYQFTATAHLAGIQLDASSATIVGKFNKYTIRARKTAFVSGTPTLQLYTGVWHEIVPAGAAIGDWYTKTIYALATYPVIICSFTSSASWEVEYLTVKEQLGNHATQPTAGWLPLYQVDGGYGCAQFDGTDDELFTGALTPNSDMDCFIAIYRNSAAPSVVAYDQLTGGFCVMDSGDAASTATFGIPATNTYAVDGVSVAGGTGTTRAQLASAVSPGAWHIIEARNLNLSSFSPLRVGNYGPTWPLEGKIGGIVLISALSTVDRNLVRTYLGSKVGLTL